MNSPVPLPLPEDAILLHLGFHKTGTTALQSAFAASRPELLEHGVLYPGRRRSHHPAAMAMTSRTWGVGREGGWDPDPRDWDRLARAAARHPGRVLISSESFALTPDDAAARMVSDLGADRVHVVFTIRPMAGLLSSSWQQYLKSGWTTTYEQWLAQIVAELEPGARRSGFWLRNDYPRIVGRWADLVGAGRVHLVCLDGSDRGYLLRTFRGLLDLPEGVPDEQSADSNRSMTAAEAELLRSLNEVTSDWDWPTYQRTIRTGAAAGMVESRQPGPGEGPIVTPRDVLERVAAHGREVAVELAALQVVVHGDLGILGQEAPAGRAGAPAADEPDGGAGALAPDDPDGGAGAPDDVPIGAAVASVLGAIRGAQRQAAEAVEAAQQAAAASAAAPVATSHDPRARQRVERPDPSREPPPPDPVAPPWHALGRVGPPVDCSARAAPTRRGPRPTVPGSSVA